MVQMYYKIPAHVAESLGLSTTLVRHPDGCYLATGAVMARIHPDITEALRLSGGIALTPDQARDDQMGLSHYPLPGIPENSGSETIEPAGTEGTDNATVPEASATVPEASATPDVPQEGTESPEEPEPPVS